MVGSESLTNWLRKGAIKITPELKGSDNKSCGVRYGSREPLISTVIEMRVNYIVALLV